MGRCYVLLFTLLVASFLGKEPFRFFVTAVDDAAAVTSKKNHLRVSIRNHFPKDAPSCQHSIAEIELLNLHSSDHIHVHSIRTTDERTVASDDGCEGDSLTDEGSPSPSSIADDCYTDLPRQLQASQLPGEFLDLGPGQVAIVPVTFLPRFPPLPTQDERLDVDNQLSADSDTHVDESLGSMLSSFQEADWFDMLEDDSSAGDSGSAKASPSLRRHRNNLAAKVLSKPSSEHSRYQVTTTILVETDDGEVELPLEATSVRENIFGLPDVIYFDTLVDEAEPKPLVSLQNGDISDNEDDEERRIRETVSLFQAVKEKEKKTLERHMMSVSAVATVGGVERTLFAGANSRTNSIGTSLKDLHSGVDAESHDVSGETSSHTTNGSVWIVDSKRLPPQPRTLVESSLSASDRTTGSSQAQKGTDGKDCFDLYMQAPSASDLRVTEVKLSRPGQLSLHILPEKARNSEGLLASFSPRPVITKWKESKPVFGDETGDGLTVPADGDRHYLVTVCATKGAVSSAASPTLSPSDLADWIDSEERDEALGFLQIKTTRNTLFIRLEKAGEEIRTRIRLAASDAAVVAKQEAGRSPLTRRKQGVGSDAHASYNHQSSGSPTAGNDTLADEPAQEDIINALDEEIILESRPERIDFHFLSSACQSSEKTIDIVNKSSRPVKIMRAAVALQPFQWDDSPDFIGSSSWELDQMGINLTVNELGQILSIPLAGDRTVVSAVTVSCSVDRSKFMNRFSPDTSVSFHGALLLRGSSRLDWSYEEWERALKANPFLDSGVVLEVPLSINIAEGKVGFLAEGTTHPVPSFWLMEPYMGGMVNIVSSAFFPLNPAFTAASLTNEERAMLVDDHSTGFDHHFRVFSNLAIDIVVDKVEIGAQNSSSPDLCSRFEAYIIEQGKSDLIDLGELTNLGLVYLRYRFPEGKEDPSPLFPTICSLRVRTKPETGVHEMPLVVYPGYLDVSGSPFPSEYLGRELNATLENKDNRSNWNHVSFGFESLLDWFRSTKSGYALRSVLKASANTDRDGPLLERYLYSLAGQSKDVEKTKLRPVLMKMGAIAQGEIETLPLYVTNYSPVPVSLRIVVGEVEGMTITLGRDDGISPIDYIPSKTPESSLDGDELAMDKGRFRGHPLGGIRRFLLEDELASNYFHKFSFRDDVSMSKFAVMKFPSLRKLFRTWTVAKFHNSPLPKRFTPSGWSRCPNSAHPPLYGPFQKKLSMTGRKSAGPVIISSDRKTARRLSVCWDAEGEPEEQKSDDTAVVVPPGGVARFDVSLRSPSNTALEKDITQFLVTGLTLSSDHGEVFPIVMSFEALQGKLELSHIPSTRTQNHDRATQLDSGTIRVPAGLFRDPSVPNVAAIKVPPHSLRSVADLARGATIVPRNATSSDDGVTVFMKSSFLRNVQLHKIESCNPWFEVLLTNQSEADADPFLGVNIGSVTSVIPCDAIDEVTQPATLFPNFFRCALNWFAKRAALQPRGCGMPPNKEHWVENSQSGERGGMDAALKALKRALLASQLSDELFEIEDEPGQNFQASFASKSGRRGEDGVVPSVAIEAMSNAWDALQSASSSGLLSIGTSLRAVIEYNSTPEEISPIKHDAGLFHERSRFLSVAIRNITIESVLETPKLLNVKESKDFSSRSPTGSLRSAQIVEFEPTQVGNVATVMLPLKNPTAVPVRVRLGVAPTEPGIDDSIRSRYLGSYQPPYVQTRQKTPSSPKDYAHHQWWDHGGAFYHPDFHGDMIRSHYNITIKSGTGAQISLVNPSFLANTAFLVGCGSRCGLRNENKGKKPFESIVNLTPTSPIGASAAAGKTLVGQERTTTQQGNKVEGAGISMAAGGSLIAGGMGPAAFGIPYSALEEIIIPPFGAAEIGPIMFRPPGRTPMMGCESMKGSGKASACGSSGVFESMVFLENSLTGLERVMVRGNALWEKIVFLDSDPNNFGDIEVRNGVQTLVFPGTVESTTPSPLPTLKQVVVHNDGDVSVVITKWYLSQTPKLYKNSPDTIGRCELNHFRLLGCRQDDNLVPFTLDPGQNRSFFIEHHPQCTKKKDFVALNLQVDQIRQNDNGDIPTATWPFSYPSKFNRRVRAHEQAASFRKPKIELLVGYEMSNEDYASCIPLSKYSGSYDGSPAITDKVSTGNSSFFVPKELLVVRRGRGNYFESALESTTLIMVVVVLACWLFILHLRFASKQDASDKFLGYLNFSKKTPKHSTTSSAHFGKHWFPAFRCLARADPTASDLQNLGREQTRLLLLARFNAMGVLPPQCFDATGIASRDRPNTSSATARRRGVSAGSRGPPTGNERVRTSEAIFGHYSPDLTVRGGFLPSQLGWRTVASRGLIDAYSLDHSPVKLKTEALLLRRKSQPILADDASVENTEVLIGNRVFNGSTSDLDSSYDELSGDDEVPKTPHGARLTMLGDVSNPLESHARLAKDEEFETASSQGSFIVHAKRGSLQQNKNGGRIESSEVVSDSFEKPNVKEVKKENNLPKAAIKEETFLVAKTDTKKENVVVDAEAAPLTTTKTKRASARTSTKFASSEQSKTAEARLQNQKTVQQRREQQEKKADTRPNKQKAKDNQKEREESLDEKNSERSKKEKVKDDRMKQGKSDKNVQSLSTPNTTPKSQSKRSKLVPVPPSSPMSVSDSPGSTGIRPPPGLLPPPGFGSASNSPLRSPTISDDGRPATVSLQVEAISGSNLFVPRYPPASSATIISDGGRLPQIVARDVSDLSVPPMDTPIGILQPPVPRDTDLSTSQSDKFPPLRAGLPTTEEQSAPTDNRRAMDFDVMDFLDGILDEGNGSTSDDGNGLVNEVASPTFPSPSFSSNPWAMDSGEGNMASRASAYGIAVEETNELLTPAAIFSPHQEENDDSKNNSFYGNLGNE